MAIPDPTEAPCLVISAWESPYVTDPHRFAMLLAAIHACDAAHGVRWSPQHRQKACTSEDGGRRDRSLMSACYCALVTTLRG